MEIGLITDGKYGERAYFNIGKRFRVKLILVPEIPLNSILDEEIHLEIPQCDLYLCYVRSPDILLKIAEFNKPMILGINPGEGFQLQIQEINPKCLGLRTMCSLLPNTGIWEIDEFAKCFGNPKYDVKIKDRIIESIFQRRISPCGSSEVGAIFLKNKELSIKNLQEFALHVCHECRAPRFGNTCDKEVAGLIHIKSLLKGVFSNKENNDCEFIIDFYKSIEYEIQKRVSNEIVFA